MAQVQFTVNELTTHDVALGENIEREIRAAAAAFTPPDTVLQCRVLVEAGVDPEGARVRIQFEKPGWVKSFGVPLHSPAEELRRAAVVVLGATPSLE
jgi:hypothetical protein